MKQLTITILLISSSVFAAGDVQQSVSSFYDFYMMTKPMGIPEQKDLKKYEPYLSVPLRTLLNEASLAELKYLEKSGGSVPPLVEDDIFTSLFEGAVKFRIVMSDMKTNSCTVEFTGENPGGKSVPFKWKDKIFCVKEPSGWKIDDIEYGGNWQFMHKGRLKDLLKDVIKNH